MARTTMTEDRAEVVRGAEGAGAGGAATTTTAMTTSSGATEGAVAVTGATTTATIGDALIPMAATAASLRVPALWCPLGEARRRGCRRRRCLAAAGGTI